jgi:hypothetical protein
METPGILLQTQEAACFKAQEIQAHIRTELQD